MAKLTGIQRARIRKATKIKHLDPSEAAGELNIIPFLDIVINLIMFLLMTTASVLVVFQLQAQQPTSGGRGGVPSGTPLNLSVTIVDEGIIVATSVGKLGPDCVNRVAGRVITIPRTRGEAYNWTRLHECVQSVKGQNPDWADEDEVIIAADPLIQYEHLIGAMDAVRKDSEGEDLFTKIRLSAGVR